MTEREIFIAALQNEDPVQRQAYLDEACAGQPELRKQVENLLGLHAGAGSFLEQPAAESAAPATLDQPVLERPGTTIGPYKLLQQIGEGGFGIVFMAEQTEPVRRRVALKVIKPGMDTRQVIARFEAERQALAVMDHPNIAKVLDAGATEGGRPYFVMELVRGTPITQYCDENSLSIRERLELFSSVCQAIQHAHTKGIIHRDIKPTNVLATRQDGQPVVKVIDFGIAKALGQQLTDKTLFTEFAQMIGTPLYMSPEQAELSSNDIDTRSDIYSLGVLLYELLTGSTPVSKEQLKAAAFDEIRRIIREDEPQKPSTRISTAEAAPSIAAQRHTEPARLARLVRGELDWIVMKTLEKDRNRRYETANGFAADVQRYLADEPVQACPPSVGYRLRKFARRNKASLAVTALVIFFLFVFGSGAGWAWRDRSAREAEAARQQGERQAKAGWQVESIFAEVDRLEREQKWPDALAAARQAEAIMAGGEVNAATAKRVRERLRDLVFIDRLEQIRMQQTRWVGTTFDHAGADREYARAFRDYGVDVEELAVETSIDRLKTRPAFAIPLAAALDHWAQARWDLRRDTAASKRLVAVARGIDPEPLRDGMRASWAKPASEVGDELCRLAESIDIRAQHPATLGILAGKLVRVKRSDFALRLLRNAQSVYPGDFWLNCALAEKLEDQKDHEGAVRFYTAAVAVRPKAVAALNNLGLALNKQGKVDEAIVAYSKAVELDPTFAYGFNNLGAVLLAQNKLDGASAAFRKAIKLDPKDATTHGNLGVVLLNQNKLDEAVAAYRKAIELDPKHVRAYIHLGFAFARQNKLDEAIAVYHKVLELDPIHTDTYFDLALALGKQGKWAEAEAVYRKVKLNPKPAAYYRELGRALAEQGKLDGAIDVLRKAIELDPRDSEAYHFLGDALWKQKKLDEAVAALLKAIELNPQYAGLHADLGLVLKDQGKLDEAVAVFHKAIELDPENYGYWLYLGVGYYRTGQWAEALNALEESCRLEKATGGQGNAWQWLWMAMAHWKLGHKDEARSWYDKAVKVEAAWPEELRRVRTEAEELLELKEK